MFSFCGTRKTEVSSRRVAIRKNIDVHDLYDGQKLDEKVVARALNEVFGARLQAEFDAKVAARRALAEPMQRYLSPLVNLMRDDRQSAKALKDVRKLTRVAGKRKLARFLLDAFSGKT
ncbi:hypothetical protein [Paraburkholderia guartelaensis]|uniref:hypothetical protein n=1 Tax=Paraburkholderia guartelaensis TaxID=2546446 RepID=UPI002AB651F1|nr:hypothetical protein [Paraburkholderia guartelaensis]